MRLSPSARPEGSRPPRIGWLTERPFAHRGLHGKGVAENSRTAFRAAIEAGYGIELDVRLSRDGYAMVFHDAHLDRLAGTAGRCGAMTCDKLSALSLAGGADRIEPLSAILSVVAGRAPLLIELKTDDDRHIAAKLCLSVRHALEGYRGDAAVMSFDPGVDRWFAEHAPRLVRGLVIGRATRQASLRRHLSLRRARPHFLAHDVRALPSRRSRAARRAGLPVLAWTVRSAAEQAAAAEHADQVIFELH